VDGGWGGWEGWWCGEVGGGGGGGGGGWEGQVMVLKNFPWGIMVFVKRLVVN